MIPFFEIPKIRRRQLAIQRMKLKSQAIRMASFRTPIVQPVIEQEDNSLSEDYQAIIKAISVTVDILGGYQPDGIDYTSPEGMREIIDYDEQDLKYEFSKIRGFGAALMLKVSPKLKRLFEDADEDIITKNYLGITSSTPLSEKLTKYLFYYYDFSDNLPQVPEGSHINLYISNPYDGDDPWYQSRNEIGFNDYSIPMTISSAFSDERGTGSLEEHQLEAFLEGFQVLFNYYVDGRSRKFPVRIEMDVVSDRMRGDALLHAYDFRTRFRVYK